MKKLIHMTRPGLIELALLLACLAMPINSNAQLFGGTIMPKRIPASIIPVIPSTITLGQNEKYFISSVYDVDYLPWNMITVPANTETWKADGKNESIILNIQGSITTVGVTVKIPVTATGSGSLPGYSSTITVPANLTEDGYSRMLTLSWAAQTYNTSTTYITATLAAVGGTLNAKKLDVNGGLGNDFVGLLMGSFSYPYNNAGNTTTFAVRDISAIPDKNFLVNDNTGSQTHNFLYLPITAEDGNLWLNNNLGADYALYGGTNFDHDKQATAYNDYHAYGNLFQWGRKPDGHDLITWTSGTVGTPVNGSTIARSNEPGDALFIRTMSADTKTDWRITPSTTLWADASSANNPCPVNFRVPTLTELTALASAAGITNQATAAASDLHLTVPGKREYKTASIIDEGTNGYYWSSTAVTGTEDSRAIIIGTTFSGVGQVRANGFSVRCIYWDEKVKFLPGI